MAYIEGYPICVTPSQIMTVGIRNPESFEVGLRTILKLDDRIWQLITDEVDEDFWFELDHRAGAYRDYSEYYDAFERQLLESLMVQSGELVQPLASGAL